MGDHNTRMQELCKEVDNLKGSMATVVNSVSDLRQLMDTKVGKVMDEIKNILMGNKVCIRATRGEGKPVAAIPDGD
ncbi:hypothetical protein CQW23_30338 [Capsicum baccatum]|uniref:Uncharacterized protein n=1 Tax=Capsicum baccatum TaxID=33114 RepID=A0A2G2VAW2_CAPBA|nr:hypothetical protein CQW23_30338 [Capsicum baccatum]